MMIEIVNADTVCDYNNGVSCESHTNCNKCGWCPAIEAERKQKLRGIE